LHYKKLRERMVRDQFIARGITDQRVLAAFYKVEREKFVPSEVRNNAYQDFPLSIGEGQTISQPYMVALMTQSLELKGDEKILEIGQAPDIKQLFLLNWLGKSIAWKE